MGGASVPMLASVLKRDLKNLIQRDASPNFQAQNGLLLLRSWWGSVGSLETGLQPPGPQGFSGELSCLMRRSDHHEAGVPSLVVNSKRDGPAGSIAGEVVGQEARGF